MQKDREEEAAARAVLERVERDTTGVFAWTLGRGARRATDDEEATRDRVEIWGRRIGRALGVVAAVLLAINLFTHWFF
jgi:hypothetical protein